MFCLGKLSWSISLVLNKVYTQINLMGLYNKAYWGGSEHYIMSEREHSV